MAWYETNFVTREIRGDKWEIMFNINGGVEKIMAAHIIVKVG